VEEHRVQGIIEETEDQEKKVIGWDDQGFVDEVDKIQQYIKPIKDAWNLCYKIRPCFIPSN
jgi:hypothetical protein